MGAIDLFPGLGNLTTEDLGIVSSARKDNGDPGQLRFLRYFAGEEQNQNLNPLQSSHQIPTYKPTNRTRLEKYCTQCHEGEKKRVTSALFRL